MDSPSANAENRGTICVFCGSSPGNDPAYAKAARRMGKLIGEGGYSLVFGGGSLGLMGEVARAAHDAGARITGILPEFLRHLEPPFKSAEETVIVPDLFERKERMIAFAHAFVVLPGGLGTLDEFFEVVTAAQLKVMARPIVLVNTNGYFDGLIAFLDRVVDRGFALATATNLFRVVATPDEAMAFIAQALSVP
jgi:uncharacterized protein (TIGR00730 family)